MLYATALAELGRYSEALIEIEQALRIAPNAPWTWHLLRANVLRDSGDVDAALAAAERLRAAHEGKAIVHNVLGLALRDVGRRKEAIIAFRQAQAIDPPYAMAYRNAALVLREEAMPDAAVAELQRALAFQPDADLMLDLAALFESEGRMHEARIQYARAIEFGARPSSDTYKGLARAEYALTNLHGAIRAYQAALTLDGSDWSTWNALGNCFLDLGMLAEAADAYKAAISRCPDISGVHDNLLLCYHYDTSVSPDVMYAAFREWEVRFSAEPLQQSRSLTNTAGPRRIGFLSHAFNRGPTAFFLLPLLRNLDRSLYSIYCYSVGLLEDDFTASIRALSTEWHAVGGMSDDEIAKKIRDDGVDVLIDLSGHATGNRLRVMSYRPAPRSATWLDYVNTTGLSTIDVFIADSVSVPLGTRQRFSERLVRIGVSRLCYEPPTYAPPVGPLPMDRNGYPTFGSFNRASKIASVTVEMWAALMHAVPNARLLLKSAVFANEETRLRFAERFAVYGMTVDRLILRGASDHRAMLEEYGEVDVSLDTFPYNGGLTTCESLLMGVPVVAVLGESLISRQTAALLTAGGFTEHIAHDASDWLRINCGLVNEAGSLNCLRRSMRGRLLASELCDGSGFARRFESVLSELLEETVGSDATSRNAASSR